MSTPSTLTGIFFEPGRTFEALRKRPRFLVAGLILLVLTIGVTGLVYQRIDMGQYIRSEEHTSELQSPCNLVCRLLLEKKKVSNHIVKVRFKHSTHYFTSITDLTLHLARVSLRIVYFYEDTLHNLHLCHDSHASALATS